MSAAPPVAAGVALDCANGVGRAVLWGMATDDLNVNLVAWPQGEGVAEHRNDARDVLVVVIDGVLQVVIDGGAQRLPAGCCIVIAKGCTRSLTAIEGGVRYLTAHMRREGLTLDARPRPVDNSA